MKITGIITEYNPFHYGHLHHIKQARSQSKCDLLICIMSGNFVQRGEPAIIDKWERAKYALANGCDIVFELPFIYATQSAAYFAQGAVELLHLAHVDTICFGSECNDLNQLIAFSNGLVDLKNRKELSTSQAYEASLGSLSPNDILGMNYIKAMLPLNIKPLPIQRTNHYHDIEIHDQFASATAIRHKIFQNESYETYTPMKVNEAVSLKQYYPYIQFLLQTLPASYLSDLFMMDEGIENQLIKNASASDFETFMNLSTSKRYTRSKIQRTLIHLLNQTSKQTVNELEKCQYLRLLACNSKGRSYLKTLKNEVTIASRFNQIPKSYRDMEWKAAIVYSKLFKNPDEIIAKECGSPILTQ